MPRVLHFLFSQPAIRTLPWTLEKTQDGQVDAAIHLKWITNKDLLYSTWNSAQCYVAVWRGGEFGESGYIHMYGQSFCCSPETITALLISYTPIQNKKCVCVCVFNWYPLWRRFLENTHSTILMMSVSHTCSVISNIPLRIKNAEMSTIVSKAFPYIQDYLSRLFLQTDMTHCRGRAVIRVPRHPAKPPS